MQIVVPTQRDPLARSALPLLGGPVGRHALLGAGFWTATRVVMLAGALTYFAGFLSKGYCLANGWSSPQNYMYLCYSDVAVLYEARGISSGAFPYLLDPQPGQEVLEYPVLTGVFMFVVGHATRLLDGTPETFFVLTAVAMTAFFLWTIACTSRTVAHRPWDGLMVAMAPVVFLSAFINWDLLAVALTSAFVLASSRDRPALAGVWLGLAVSAKFYPLVLLGALFLYCARRGMWSRFVITTAMAAVSWAVVNVPVMAANFDGWARFYRFSAERGIDFGSPWYALELLGFPVREYPVNEIASGAFAVACLGIAALALRRRGRWATPTAPRLASMAFLTVAAFAITNKVYSPQFVLWLLPLAVLARPRWRDLIIWQVGEAIYFVAVWWYLVGFGEDDKGLPPRWYAAAVFVHVTVTAWLMLMVVRDMRRPELDPVRVDPVWRPEPLTMSAHHHVRLDGRESDITVDQLADGGRDGSTRDAQHGHVHVGGL